jgi:hypothetical protein
MLAGAALVAAAPPPLCPPDRWIADGGATFDGQPLILGVETSPASMTVPGCDATALKRARAKAKKKGTQLTAMWRDCAGLKRLVFAGQIVNGCTQLEGKLRGKRTKVDVTASPSRCGDGVVDTGGGEQCESTCPAGQVCTTACLCEPVATSTTSTITTTTVSTSSTVVMTPIVTTTTLVVTPLVTPLITPLITPIILTPVVTTTTTTLVTPLITPLVTPLITPIILTPVVTTTTTTLITPLVTPIILTPIFTTTTTTFPIIVPLVVPLVTPIFTP